VPGTLDMEFIYQGSRAHLPYLGSQLFRVRSTGQGRTDSSHHPGLQEQLCDHFSDPL
jgi:hypothetical protein